MRGKSIPRRVDSGRGAAWWRRRPLHGASLAPPAPPAPARFPAVRSSAQGSMPHASSSSELLFRFSCIYLCLLVASHGLPLVVVSWLLRVSMHRLPVEQGRSWLHAQALGAVNGAAPGCTRRLLLWQFPCASWVLGVGLVVAALQLQLLLGLWDLPGPGIKPVSPALGRWILTHCTTREAPGLVCHHSL